MNHFGQLITRAQMQEEESRALAQGLAGSLLMETAGRHVAGVVSQLWSDGRSSVGKDLPGLAWLTTRSHRDWPMEKTHREIWVICGPGNNGGDGFVAARCLNAWGLGARCLLLGKLRDLRGDAALHASIFTSHGGVTAEVVDEKNFREVLHSPSPLLVDALFGTGLSRDVSGTSARLIAAINSMDSALVVSVDVPSGICSDSGQVLGEAIRAHVTVSFGRAKRGCFLSPGWLHAGAVAACEIGVRGPYPSDVTLSEPPVLPRDNPLAHKHQRGHVLAIAGIPQMAGAADLAAKAAVATSVGLVTLAGASTQANVPSCVLHADFNQSTDLPALLKKKDVVVIGPGFGLDPARQQLFEKLIEAALQTKTKLVIDADGLTILAKAKSWQRFVGADIILTPHAEEAARILESTAAEIQKDAIGALRALIAKTHAAVILKGPRTLLGMGQGTTDVSVNLTGNSALATAGTGDVLAGTIAGLWARYSDREIAARGGVYAHGLAAEMYVENHGKFGLTADVLAGLLPQALTRMACPSGPAMLNSLL